MSSLFTEIRDAATQRGAKGACYLSSLPSPDSRIKRCLRLVLAPESRLQTKALSASGASSLKNIHVAIIMSSF